MTKAVIFDLGNTLLRQDNIDWKKFERAGLLNHISIFEKRDLPGPNLKEWSAQFHRLQGACEIMSKAHQVEIPLERIFQIMLEFYEIPADIKAAVLVSSYCQPLVSARLLHDEALETLHKLSHQGLRMGIVSNTSVPGALVREMLERLQILSFFEFTFFSSEFIFRKPNAVMFEAALKRFGLVASAVTHVGDQWDQDVVGAGAVGIRTIWLNREHGAVKKGKIQPHATIATLKQLPDILKKLR